MKFFVYSKCGEGAGLALKLRSEGNDVSMFIKEQGYQNVYDGLISKSNKIDKEAIVIFDSSGMGDKADDLRKDGFQVIGASRFHDRLENDREFGLAFMKYHGVDIPEMESFSIHDWEDAIEFIQKNDDKRFVFKPSGDLPSKLTFSSEDPEQLILYMEYVKENFGSKIDEFILQEFVEGDILSTEYWVGPKGFVGPVNHTIEVKKFLNGDLGPSTGCSGNVVWVGEDSCKTAKLLKSCEEFLVSQNYLGPIDLNCILGDKTWGLEWTPRFGLDAMPTFLPLLDMEVGKFFSDLNQGIDQVKLNRSYSAGVRVTIPPYPIETDDVKRLQNVGIPILGLEEDVYLYEVMLNKEQNLVHSNGTGVIAVVVRVDEEPDCAVCDCVNILDECRIPDKQYRTDLHEVIPPMIEKVQEKLYV